LSEAPQPRALAHWGVLFSLFSDAPQKGRTMGYSIVVDGFNHPFVIHNARTWLYRSHDALEAGYQIEAAALLLEGIRIFLKADAAYWGVVPRDERPINLAKALRKAGQLEDYPLLGLIIGVCNDALRCKATEAAQIAFALRMMHSFCDGTRYLIEADASGRLS